jgi:uncharacterized protein involved in exopolysaccharide biosynthesis
MADLEILRSKIIELKRKRDDFAGLAAKERQEMTNLDEQIADLERQKSKIKMSADDKES